MSNYRIFHIPPGSKHRLFDSYPPLCRRFFKVLSSTDLRDPEIFRASGPALRSMDAISLANLQHIRDAIKHAQLTRSNNDTLA